jgi:hypothetical protein
MRILLALGALALLAGCGASPCAKVCQKLGSCNALSVSVDQCTKDCEQPANGHSCANEDAIASCMDAASCDDLTKESSRLKCPACQ